MKSGYFKHFYKGNTEEEIKKSIEDEGFKPLRVQNTSNYEYDPHQHASIKVLAFLSGSMEVSVDGTIYHCAKDDRVVIASNAVHAANVGEGGCEFFWAEN